MSHYLTSQKLIHIVAVSADGIIGYKDGFPWDRLDGDLPRFSQITKGCPILMGRKTLETLPRLLPGRTHLVLTRQPEITFKGQTVRQNDFEDEDSRLYCSDSYIALLESCERKFKGGDVYIIGGGEIYEQTLDYVHAIRMTRVHQTFEDLRENEPESLTWYPQLGTAWKQCWSYGVRGSHTYIDYVRDWDDPRTTY